MANGDEVGLLGGIGDVFTGSSQYSPLLSIGAGLLSASGPSATPTSFGQRLGQGLTAAGTFQAQMDRNQAARQALAQRAELQRARQQLFQPQQEGAAPPIQGLLGGQPSPQELGLLAQAFPSQIGSLMSRSGGQERRPNSLIEQAQFAFPDDQDKQRQFVAQNAGQDDIAAQLGLLQARQRQIEIENALRDRQEADESREQKRGKLIASVAKDLEDARRLAEINSELQGTLGESGVPLSDVRRAIASGAGALGDLVGADTSETKRIVNLMDEFEKISTRFATQSAVDLFDSGNITNFQLQAIQAATPNPSIAPEANNRIIADSIEAILGGADRAGIEIQNRNEFDRLARQLRGEPAQEAPANPDRQDQPRQRGAIRFLGFE